MEMSDKEFKQRMCLALASNPELHNIAKSAQSKGVPIGEALTHKYQITYVSMSINLAANLTNKIIKPV